jgi:hypothetical protein
MAPFNYRGSAVFPAHFQNFKRQIADILHAIQHREVKWTSYRKTNVAH